MTSATPPRPVRVAVYARISQDRASEAERRGLGTDRQIRLCEELANKNGWTVAPHLIFKETNTSAFRGTRPQYQAMLDAVRGRHVDAIVAWHPDRLYRRMTDLLTFTDVVKATGVEVHTVTGGGRVDLSTPQGVLNAHMLGVIAEYESAHKAERIRAKQAELVAAGRRTGGTRMYGYETDGTTVREDEAEIVREMAARLRQGDGVRTIVLDLNKREIPTSTGRQWAGAVVRTLLKNPRLGGEFWFKGTDTGLRFPGVLDADTALAVRSLLNDPGRRVNPNGNRRTRLLTGLLRCGGCGERMTGKIDKHGRAEYRCGTAVRAGSGVDHVTRAGQPTDRLAEALAVQYLTAVGAQAAPEDDPDTARLLKALCSAQSRLTGLADALAQGVSPATIATAESKINTEIAALTSDLAARQSSNALRGMTGANARKAWEAASVERRRAVLRALFDRIEVHKTTVRGRYDWSAVHFLWAGTEGIRTAFERQASTLEEAVAEAMHDAPQVGAVPTAASRVLGLQPTDDPWSTWPSSARLDPAGAGLAPIGPKRKASSGRR